MLFLRTGYKTSLKAMNGLGRVRDLLLERDLGVLLEWLKVTPGVPRQRLKVDFREHFFPKGMSSPGVQSCPCRDFRALCMWHLGTGQCWGRVGLGGLRA